MKKRTFVTVFPAAKNVHLLKDVGMLPYIMYREYGYDAYLVSLDSTDEYLALKDEVAGLKHISLQKTTNLLCEIFSVCKYLCFNARKIDILNLYHLSKRTFLYGTIYKILNAHGVLYIKSDLNIEQFRLSLGRFRRCGYSLFLHRIPDLVSYELDVSGALLNESFPHLTHTFLKISNGIDDYMCYKHFPSVLPFSQKQNIFITVGRIGAPEKNHIAILNALEKISLNDWSFVFIGPVEKDFEKCIASFFSRNQDKVDKVVFLGEISSKKELYDWYNRAKVFCLPSKWDCFPLVFPEALFWGNYIISSNVQAVSEITKEGTIGTIVYEESDFQHVFWNIVNDKIPLEEYYDSILEHSRNYIWKDILHPLDERLKQLMK